MYVEQVGGQAKSRASRTMCSISWAVDLIKVHLSITRICVLASRCKSSCFIGT